MKIGERGLDMHNHNARAISACRRIVEISPTLKFNDRLVSKFERKGRDAFFGSDPLCTLPSWV
jgi:hypothetical protein